MTELVKQYMRLIVEEHIDDHDDDGAYHTLLEKRDALWEQMSQDEQAEANRLVEDIFGDWL